MSIDDYFRQSFESIKRENCETRISNVNCNTTMTLSSIITVVIECVLCLFWDLITFYKCARGYACGFSVFFTRFHHRHTLGRLELKIKNKTKPKKKSEMHAEREGSSRYQPYSFVSFFCSSAGERISTIIHLAQAFKQQFKRLRNTHCRG